MIPFVGPSSQLRRKKADVQRAVNLFPSFIESNSGKAQMFLKSIPGLRTFTRDAIQILKTQSADEVVPDAVHTYTIVATNTTGLDDPAGARIRDVMPGGFTFTACTIAYVHATGPSTATQAELLTGIEITSWAINGTVTLTITGTFAAEGTFENTATALATSYPSSSSTVTTTVAAPPRGLLCYFTTAGVPAYSAHSDIGPDVVGSATTVQTGGEGIISVPGERFEATGIDGTLGAYWRIEAKAKRTQPGGYVFFLSDAGAGKLVAIRSASAGSFFCTPTAGLMVEIANNAGGFSGDIGFGPGACTENPGDVYHYYCAQFDGVNLSFYLDGVRVGYRGTAGEWTGVAFTNYVGGGVQLGNFAGSIDWIAFNPDVQEADLYSSSGYTPTDPYPSWA